MITAPELEKQPYRIACGTVWGGIKPVSLDVCTKGVTVSLHSTASGGDRGGAIYYISVRTADLRTRMLVADVRGHGERVSEISSWIYESLQDKMNSVDRAQVLSDLNCGSVCGFNGFGRGHHRSQIAPVTGSAA